jgi:hypothetical protein
MLWTGKAIRVARTDVNMDVMQINGVDIPAMPDDLFGEVNSFLDLFQGVNDYRAIGSMARRTRCLTTLTNVSCIPLTPSVEKLAKEKHRLAILERHDGLDNLITQGIDARNIGSNRGLLKMLREHYNKKLQPEGLCTKYSIFNTDIDIFERGVKVNTTHCTQLKEMDQLYIYNILHSVEIAYQMIR